jgi:hypothetical protein
MASGLRLIQSSFLPFSEYGNGFFCGYRMEDKTSITDALEHYPELS